MSAHLMTTVAGQPSAVTFDLREPNAPLLTTAGTTWAGLPFELHHVGSAADLATVSPADQECGLVVMMGGSLDVVLREADGEQSYRAETGAVDLLSSGARRQVLHVSGSGTAAGVRVTPEWLRRLAFDEEPSAFGLATPFMPDQTVHQLVQTMCNEVARNAVTGPLFAESLSLSLLSYVTRRLLSGGDDVRGTLSRVQRQRLRGHIADHLASELSLVELASMVGLGPRRFSTLFREAFGVTPHKYVVQQRLTEGARLLMEENADIAEIATRVGFCSQSHFTAAFRVAYGVTPRRYWLDARRRLTTTSA